MSSSASITFGCSIDDYPCQFGIASKALFLESVSHYELGWSIENIGNGFFKIEESLCKVSIVITGRVVDDEIHIRALRIEFGCHCRAEDLQLLHTIAGGQFPDFIEMFFNCRVHRHRISSSLSLQSIAIMRGIPFSGTLPV